MIFYILAMVAGIAAASQAAANAGLAGRVGLGAALVVNSIIVIAMCLGIWVWQGMPGNWFARGLGIEFYLGGLFGFAIIACAAVAFPKVGAGVSIGLMVLGQGLMALIIDQYGLWGMPQISANPTRYVGLALVVAGVFLLQR